MLHIWMKKAGLTVMLMIAVCFCVNTKVKAADRVYYNSYGVAVNGACAMGIDVSSNNGTVDWAAVKASGVEFAILRCGFGMNLQLQDDKQWEANVA